MEANTYILVVRKKGKTFSIEQDFHEQPLDRIAGIARRTCKSQGMQLVSIKRKDRPWVKK